MNKSPSLKKQASAIFIGNLVGTVFQFLIPAIIVRLISQEDFGVFRQFQLVSGTFGIFLGMGINSSLFYFYPTSDFKGKQKIIQQTRFLFLINFLLFLIIFFFYGDEILDFLNFSEFKNMKPYILTSVFLMIIPSGITFIFTLEKNTLLNKVYPSISKILRFLIFLIVILLIPGYKGPIIATILFQLTIFLYFFIHTFQYFKNIYKIDLDLLKDQLFYVLPFGAALILNLISTKFDKFFINKYITPQEFGIYSIAFLSIPILKQFFSSIHNVVVPEISLKIKNNEMYEATNLWRRTVEKTSSVTIPAVFIFWLLANEIITIIYTIEYLDAANYYRIFILMFFVSMFSHEIILRGSNKTKYILFSNIVGTIFTVTIGFLLIPKVGLYGAIITALLGSITPMIISLHIERRIMNISFRNWVNWKKIIINFFICFLISIPIFIFKDYIGNIYLRVFVVGMFFFPLVTFFQIKFDIFIFTQYISIFKRYLK